MKKLNFETSKGNFVVVDMPDQAKHIEFARYSYGVYLCWHDGNFDLSNDNYESGQITLRANYKHSFKILGYISEITEQQASEIVEEYFSTTTNEIDGYFDYRDDTQTDCPIESLHSIFELNGYYLFENPYGKEYPEIPIIDGSNRHKQIIEFSFENQQSKWKEEQDKTFFNPIIFKLV